MSLNIPSSHINRPVDVESALDSMELVNTFPPLGGVTEGIVAHFHPQYLDDNFSEPSTISEWVNEYDSLFSESYDISASFDAGGDLTAPQYKANVLNGYGGATFDGGTTGLMTDADPWIRGGVTALFVYQGSGSAASNNECVWTDDRWDDPQLGFAIGFNGSTLRVKWNQDAEPTDISSTAVNWWDGNSRIVLVSIGDGRQLIVSNGSLVDSYSISGKELTGHASEPVMGNDSAGDDGFGGRIVEGALWNIPLGTEKLVTISESINRRLKVY